MKQIPKLTIMIFIPVWWISMVSSLIVRSETADKSLNYLTSAQETFDPEIGTRWYSVEKDGVQIGFMMQTLSESEGADAGQTSTEDDAYVIREISAMQAEVAGELLPVVLSQTSFLGSDFQVVSSQGRLAVGSLSLKLVGERQGDIMHYSLLGDDIEQEFSTEENPTTSFAMYLALAAQDQKENETYWYEIFNPVSQTPIRSTIRYIGKDLIDFAGQQVESKVFEMSSFGLESIIWIDMKGNLLKEESSGYTTYKVNFETVMDIYHQFNIPDGLDSTV